MIYTFYSYKGGVGRSMALANIAELLCRLNLRVLMIDWDLEAPGLERFYPGDVDRILEHQGLREIIEDYRRIVSTPNLDTLDQKDLIPVPNFSDYCIRLHSSSRKAGELWMLPAGRRTGNSQQGYINFVQNFDWKDFYKRWRGDLFFEWLRTSATQFADVVLIDSRTGITEIGGICTYQMADVVIMLCAPNQQGLLGTLQMANSFVTPQLEAARDGRRLRVIVIPSRIDKHDSYLVDQFQHEFARIFTSNPKLKLEALWELHIPYVPKYSFQEQISVTDGEAASGADLVDAYEKICKHVLGISPPTSIELERKKTAYLQWLIDRNSYLDSRGTYQTQRQVQLRLDEVYVTLRIRLESKPDYPDSRLLEDEITPFNSLTKLNTKVHDGHYIASEYSHMNSTLFELDQVIRQQNCVVILGAPGSGKTTLLRYLALTHAQAILNSSLANNRSPAQSFFPIFIRIAAYTEQSDWQKLTLDDYLSRYIENNDFTQNANSFLDFADLFTKELSAGGCLLLLDGLDEIVTTADRHTVVHKIEDFVQRHATGGLRGENRFVITSRTAGYRSTPINIKGLSFTHYEVIEMDLLQIERFVTRWCSAVEDTQTPDLPIEVRNATAQREINGILGTIKANEGIRRLATNPLMLRTFALIHRTGAKLPQRRIELYKLAADTLARTWRPAQQVRMGDTVSKLLDETYLTRLLGKLAYWLHLHKPTGLATEQEVHARLGEEWAAILGRPWDEDQPDTLVLDEVKKFLVAVREHTGLFVERAPKRYGFMHLTFEEYYAARYLVARSRTRAKLIRQHLHDPRWEEPILLALGFVGLDAPADAAELVETAILAQGEEAEDLGFTPSPYEDLLNRDYLFALRCLGDRIPTHPQIMTQLINRVQQELLNPTDIATFQSHKTLLTERVKELAGSIVSPMLVELLLPHLHSSDVTVRSRVVASLGQVKNGTPNVIDGLLAALRDDDIDVRIHAAESLVQLGSSAFGVIEGLLVALRDNDIDIRFRAAASLIQLNSSTTEMIEGLLTALYDIDSEVRKKAAMSLGLLSSSTPEVIEGLLVALQDTEADIRSLAAACLGQLGKGSLGVIEGLLASLHDSNALVRRRAVTSLEQLNANTPEVIEGLIAALDDTDHVVRMRVMESLGQLGISKPRVINSLLAALHDNNTAVRRRAVESLGQLGNSKPTVIRGLVSMLNDTDATVRFQVVVSLKLLGGITEQIIEDLFASLYNDDAEISFQVAVSLGQLGNNSPTLISIWKESLEQSNSWYNRQCCAQLLGEYGTGDPDLIELLLRGLLDSDNAVRAACSVALVQLTKRFSHIKMEIEKQLAAAIRDPRFEKADNYERTGQDYAHETLWQVVS